MVVNVMATAFLKQFGLRIRQLREQQGISQEALADAAGLHRTHISLIERGQRDIRLSTIEKLAKALGAQPQDLMLPPSKR